MTLINYTGKGIQENGELLVDLSRFGFVLDPKYFQWGHSDTPKMFLRESVAQKLLKIQTSLGGLKFKIWDGFRPRALQNAIYQKYWRELAAQNPNWTTEELELAVGKFVSPPYQKDRIPPHSTGGAVDLTLVDKSGKELDMGTEFDFFGAEAGVFFYEIYRGTPMVTENRKILREAMLSEDFTLDEAEWWHFDSGNQSWALKKEKPFAFFGETKITMH